MKSITLIIASLITFNVCSLAQSTPKKEAIKELLAIMHQDSLMVKMMKQMTTAMSTGMNATMQKANIADTFYSNNSKMMMDKSMEATKGIMLRMVKEDMVDVYDKYFSMQEIQDFMIFYKSKSGQKLLEKTPDLSNDMITIMQTKYGAEMQQAMMKAMEEMKSARQ